VRRPALDVRSIPGLHEPLGDALRSPSQCAGAPSRGRAAPGGPGPVLARRWADTPQRPPRVRRTARPPGELSGPGGMTGGQRRGAQAILGSLRDPARGRAGRPCHRGRHDRAARAIQPDRGGFRSIGSPISLGPGKRPRAAPRALGPGTGVATRTGGPVGGRVERGAGRRGGDARVAAGLRPRAWHPHPRAGRGRALGDAGSSPLGLAPPGPERGRSLAPPATVRRGPALILARGLGSGLLATPGVGGVAHRR
jgi:hypothetical protein